MIVRDKDGRFKCILETQMDKFKEKVRNLKEIGHSDGEIFMAMLETINEYNEEHREEK